MLYILYQKMPDFQDFPRIFASPNHEGEITISDKYKHPKDLGNRFVTRFTSNGVHRFRVFESYDSYVKHISTLKRELRCFNEVTFPHHRQKFKLDIDVATSKFANSDYMPIIERFITLVQAAFAIGWGLSPVRSDFVVLSSSDASKISYHVVLDKYSLKDYRDAKQVYDDMIFVTQLCKDFDDIAPRLADIDKGVYNKTQSFRLPGNCKEHTTRFMEIVPNTYEHTSHNATITQFDKANYMKIERHSKVIAILEREKNKSEAVIEDSMVKLAVEMAESVTEGCQYARKKGAFIFYDRMTPGYCKICDREHDKYASPYLHLVSDGSKTHVRFKCLRGKADAAKYTPSIYLGAIDCSDPQLMVPRVVNTKSNIGKIISTAASVQMPILSDRRTKIYDSPKLADFKLAETLLVRAAMGMGKTKKLQEYIASHFTKNAYIAPDKEYKILIVSFRRSYTADIRRKFSDYVVYSDVRGPLIADKLIVQVESLHRIPETAEFDLLVLDETESDFEQFMSGLGMNPRKSWETIERLMVTSAHVVCMDAHLGSRTINMVQRLRPNRETKLQWNIYKNGFDKTYNLTSNLGAFLETLKSDISCGNKIVVPTNSHKYAITLQKFISSSFPALRIGLFDRHMSQEQKVRIFENVDSEWVNYDIVIYTPTITAGVSFEVPYFHSVYAMFTGKSCGVESCLQMIARVRDLSTKTINVYFNCFGDRLPTDISEIEKCLYNETGYFEGAPELDQMPKTYNGNHNKCMYVDTPYFRLWLENMRVRNISSNNFIKHFVGYIVLTGAQIFELGELDVESAGKLAREFRDISRSMDAEFYENIAKSTLVGSDEADIIQRVQDSATDKFALLKWDLFNYYKLNPVAKICPKMIKQYSSESTKLMYSELGRILRKPKLRDALNEIIADRNKDYKLRVLSGALPNIRADELVRAHVFCVEFMEAFGLDRFPRADQGRYYMTLADPDEVKKGIDGYKTSIDYCSKVLDTRTGKVECIEDFIKYGSRILRRFYGLKWKLVPSADIYLIVYNNEQLFDIGETHKKEDKPFIKRG